MHSACQFTAGRVSGWRALCSGSSVLWGSRTSLGFWATELLNNPQEPSPGTEIMKDFLNLGPGFMGLVSRENEVQIVYACHFVWPPCRQRQVLKLGHRVPLHKALWCLGNIFILHPLLKKTMGTRLLYRKGSDADHFNSKHAWKWHPRADLHTGLPK